MKINIEAQPKESYSKRRTCGNNPHGGLSKTVLAVALLLVVGSLAGGGKDKDEPKPDATATVRAASVEREKDTPSQEPVTTPAPTEDIASLPALDYIKVIAEREREDLTYQLKDVTREDGFWRIDLDVGTDYGGTRSFVSGLCRYTLSVAESIFVREDIDEISVSCFADLRDKYGNLTSLRVFNIWLSRETFAKINVEWMEDKVLLDPDALFRIADGYSIHSLFRDY